MPLVKSRPLVSILQVVVALVMIGCVCEVSDAQRRTRPTQRTSSSVDYSKFSHQTAKHQAACNTCHKIPTSNWQRTSGFPDIADYPGHSSCVSCHRSQFFKGARPVICSNCHVKTSPRDDARLLFRDATSESQFQIEFPHDKHQDVIARLRAPSEVRFTSIAFRSTDDKQQTYNNCEICHAPLTNVPKAPTGGWTDNVQPDQTTFRSLPDSHASCFACHWKAQAPVAENCNGCHKLSQLPHTSDFPTRISLKFKHEGGGEKKNHVAECTTCHINITKAASLRGLKPDVPVTSCTECHNKEGLRQDLSKELVALDKDSTFVCNYCHTSNIGRQDAPLSHYLIAERPPHKRKESK